MLVHASFTGGRVTTADPAIYDDFVEWRERVSRKRIHSADAAGMD